MIFAPSSNSKFTVTFQGGGSSTPGNWLGYTLSRSMLRIKREDQQKVSVVIINYSYYTDPTGVLEIPLQDIINEYAAANPPQYYLSVVMTETDGTFVDDFSIMIDIVPGIDFASLFAPRNKDAQQFFASLGHNVVMPPNVIIQHNNAYNIGIKVESNIHLINNSCVWKQYVSGVGATITPAGVRTNRIDIADNAEAMELSDGVDAKRWTFLQPDYCTDLVVCRWTSRTGCIRQHWFPIVSFTGGVDSATSVVEAGNGYDVRKASFDAVRCRLTGLTAYGYWYYMDIARASDLHAVIQPTLANFETEIASMETAAFCDVQEMTTPQGNGFFNFEFVLKLRHYDTY